jgi:hypothetical protein
MPLDIVHSVCPHDCPSTCALDVERLSPTRIGRVHGSANNRCTAGVVVVESIWPNDAFEEGIGINALTSADAGPPKGGAVFHDTAVWVRRG